MITNKCITNTLFHDFIKGFSPITLTYLTKLISFIKITVIIYNYKTKVTHVGLLYFIIEIKKRIYTLMENLFSKHSITIWLKLKPLAKMDSITKHDLSSK